MKEIKKFIKWLFEVNFLRGLGSVIYVFAYFTFINLVLIGLKNRFFNNYFEILIVFAFMIFFINKADITISKSDNGYFSLVLWLMTILFILGLIFEDYNLYAITFKILGGLIGVHIVYILLKVRTRYIMRTFYTGKKQSQKLKMDKKYIIKYYKDNYIYPIFAGIFLIFMIINAYMIVDLSNFIYKVTTFVNTFIYGFIIKVLIHFFHENKKEVKKEVIIEEKKGNKNKK